MWRMIYLFVLTGIFNILVVVVGALHPHIRLVEDELPDAITGQAGLARP